MKGNRNWTIEGQMGDKVRIEAGRGSVYITGQFDGEWAPAAVDPATARIVAAWLLEAADAAEVHPNGEENHQ